MYDVLRGSPWEILRAFLSPDILLRLRTTERFGTMVTIMNPMVTSSSFC